MFHHLMKNDRYRIEVMTRREVDLAIDWAGQEGWNPGIDDARAFYATDPEGFFVGKLDGEPMACISAVRYGETFGFIGFYLVKPEYRGQGYGIQIWRKGLESLENRTIGLDGVVAQQANYEREGFQLAYRNIRYEGQVTQPGPGSDQLLDLRSLPWEVIEGYDRDCFPERRKAFLREWMRPVGGHALGLMEAGRLAGYGVIRPCWKGYKIGPLFADRPEGAEVLFQGLTSRLSQGSFYYFDVPEVNRAAVELAQRYRMQMVFETARMYKGVIPEVDLARVYGVTTFELG